MPSPPQTQTKTPQITPNQGQQWDLVIRSGLSAKNYWRDLWRYRELLYFLTWRDILVRYKQTVAGAAWAILRPLLTTLVFTVIFGQFGKFPSGGVPYPILVLSAMLPWQFFSSALTTSTQSLVNSSNLISKIYFPRMIVPASTLGVAMVDFLITLGILFIFMLGYGVPPTWRLLTLPLFVLLAIVAALGPGLLISALMVKYRDFKHIVPFLVQLGTYVSPVGFKSSVVPDQWRLLYSCNPIVGVIDGFRWAVYGDPDSLYMPGFLLSSGLSLLFLALGILHFRKAEKSFADVI
jgi:lipopolysaccharide transport system permease protein